MKNNDLTFSRNNVSGIQSSGNIIRLIKYLKSKLNHHGVLFGLRRFISVKL